MSKLVINNLHVTIAGKDILKGVSLTIPSGEVHVIMGPNGSGKSTLAYALMGHPSYEVKSQKSKVKINGENILNLKPDERARMGLFLAFQNPLTVSGVPVASLLRTSYQRIKKKLFSKPGLGKNTQIKSIGSSKQRHELSVFEFNTLLEQKAKDLNLDLLFLRRSLNDGFSGGEKKKVEMLQALVLSPKFAILDEIDTGLDIDALKTVALGIRKLVEQGSGVLIITHYQRLLHIVSPDYVHILMDGKIVQSGSVALVEQIEKHGYQSFLKR